MSAIRVTIAHLMEFAVKILMSACSTMEAARCFVQTFREVSTARVNPGFI